MRFTQRPRERRKPLGGSSRSKPLPLSTTSSREFLAFVDYRKSHRQSVHASEIYPDRRTLTRFPLEGGKKVNIRAKTVPFSTPSYFFICLGCCSINRKDYFRNFCVYTCSRYFLG